MQDPTLPQALHPINGDTLNKKLMSDQGVIAQMVAAGKSNGEIVEQLYLSALSRRPTDAERTGILADLERTPAADATAHRRQIEDLSWALATAREFLFNH